MSQLFLLLRSNNTVSRQPPFSVAIRSRLPTSRNPHRNRTNLFPVVGGHVIDNAAHNNASLNQRPEAIDREFLRTQWKVWKEDVEIAHRYNITLVDQSCGHICSKLT